MNFETIIGIEIHVELSTKEKMFSTGINNINSPSNQNVTVVDAAMPGTLPVLNHQAVEYALKAALALNCKINQKMHFDRKNYFYFDNPKQFQITQNETPIGYDGYIEVIDSNGSIKKVEIERIHLEEDTAKSIHDGQSSYIDYNRVGIPLIEIVSKPTIKSPKEAYEFLRNLKLTLEKINISDLKMEEGSLRCDANISIRPIGMKEFNPKVEIKNLNSFSFAEKALEYEVERQIKLYLANEAVEQSTRRYDEATKKTILMRKKQGKADYHYQFEADIPFIELSDEEIKQTKESLPLSHTKQYLNYVNMNLGVDNSLHLVFNQDMANFFDLANENVNSQTLFNFLKTEVQTYLKKNNLTYQQFSVTPLQIRDIIKLVDTGSISNKIAREVLNAAINAENSIDVIEYVKTNDLMQINDPMIIRNAVKEVLAKNSQAVEELKNGKKNLYGYLVGQIIKVGNGKFNPELINQIISEELK